MGWVYLFWDELGEGIKNKCDQNTSVWMCEIYKNNKNITSNFSAAYGQMSSPERGLCLIWQTGVVE